MRNNEGDGDDGEDYNGNDGDGSGGCSDDGGSGGGDIIFTVQSIPHIYFSCSHNVKFMIITYCNNVIKFSVIYIPHIFCRY